MSASALQTYDIRFERTAQDEIRIQKKEKRDARAPNPRFAFGNPVHLDPYIRYVLTLSATEAQEAKPRQPIDQRGASSPSAATY